MSNMEQSSLLQSPKQEIQIVASPKHTFLPLSTNFNEKDKISESENELHDSVDGELSPLVSTPVYNCDEHNHVKDTLNSPTDAEVDMPDINFETTSQENLASSNIINSSSDISVKGGGNSDIESLSLIHI